MSGAFTPEDTAKLIEWRVQGLSYAAIAEKFNDVYSVQQLQRRIAAIAYQQRNGGKKWLTEQDIARMKEVRRNESITATRNATKGKKRSENYLLGASKCWSCTHAAGQNMCRWALWLEPVDGWTATYRPVRQSMTEELTPSYFVHECPQYEREAVRR